MAKVKNKIILVIWIITAPLASSLTYQTPHALRALSLVIPLTMIMSYGLWVMSKWVSKQKIIFIIVITILTIILVFETTHYLDEYYIHYPKTYPLAWEYGFKQMVNKLTQYQDGYTNIVITDRYDQPYILVLFYEKYPPALYQPQAHLTQRDKFNFGTIRQFDKYEFHSITEGELRANPDTLFIGTGKEIPKSANIIDQINFPDGSPAFIFATSRKTYAYGGIN